MCQIKCLAKGRKYEDPIHTQDIIEVREDWQSFPKSDFGGETMVCMCPKLTKEQFVHELSKIGDDRKSDLRKALDFEKDDIPYVVSRKDG